MCLQWPKEKTPPPKKNQQKKTTVRHYQKCRIRSTNSPTRTLKNQWDPLTISSSCIGVVRYVVHEDIKLKSYIIWKGQFMSNSTRENRVIWSKRLLKRVKHSVEWSGFFSEEKKWVQDKKNNRRNDRCKYPILCITRSSRCGSWSMRATSWIPTFPLQRNTVDLGLRN